MGGSVRGGTGRCIRGFVGLWGGEEKRRPGRRRVLDWNGRDVLVGHFSRNSVRGRDHVSGLIRATFVQMTAESTQT